MASAAGLLNHPENPAGATVGEHIREMTSLCHKEGKKVVFNVTLAIQVVARVKPFELVSLPTSARTN